MAEITFDTETCGLHGPIVLVQYAEGDGDVHLYSPWENPVSETLRLYEKFASNPDGVVGFNLAFDWFHIYQQYTVFKLLEEIEGPDAIPEEHIPLIVELEEQARDYPLCLKPVTALDLFLHARKGPYQSTMERKNVIIRKVPSSIAWLVAKELEKRIPLRDIYFARRKDKYKEKWQLRDRKDGFGFVDSDWKDIVVRFKPSSALKALAVDALNVPEDEILRFGDISPKLNPVEFGYAPYAKAAVKIQLKNKSKERKREGYTYKRTWPDVIKQHIIHWGYNELAREYARKDVVYTRALRLHKDFINAKPGDDDSILACMVGCNRWRGYRLNLEGIRVLRQKAIDSKYWINNQGVKELLPSAPRLVKNFIMAVCNETEKLGIMQADTGKVTLQQLAENKDWFIPCPECSESGEEVKCKHCKSKRFVLHPAQERALLILRVRRAGKEIELYDKLLAAGRLHASFKVIGALSSRMSGADGLNPQGIKKSNEVKQQFLFAWEGEVLGGGDFSAFEVTIAVAVFGDEELERELLTCEACKGPMIFNQGITDYVCVKCGGHDGMKIHALFGIHAFPPMTYEEIKATDGDKVNDIYTRCKSAVFTLIYMGGPHSMHKKLNVAYEVAEEAERKFKRKYKGVGRAQEAIVRDYGSMRQPLGRGSKVEWHEPKETVTTLFGFSRYFTLENRICRSLYELANKMPKNMRNLKVKVIRTDREQFAGGAAMSAIFAAAFALQSHNVRAAGNHIIQGTGAQITKKVQRRIWDIQPSGVHPWLVQPMNIHDSVMTPMKPEVVAQVEKVVKDAVEEVRPVIPLIKMPWKSFLENWADKKGKKRDDTSTVGKSPA